MTNQADDIRSVTDEDRSIFDWVVFAIIHFVLVGAIGYAGFTVYGSRLGGWVAASAFIAGMTSMYLFAKIVPGETLMKVWLGLCVAANAGYLVHNGAKAMGVQLYNDAQIKKYEVGMAQAARSSTKAIAQRLGASAKSASELAKVFDDEVSLIAAVLAFLELSSAIVIFSIASKRIALKKRQGVQRIVTPVQAGYQGERLFRLLPDGRREIVSSTYPEDKAGDIWPAEIGENEPSGESVPKGRWSEFQNMPDGSRKRRWMSPDEERPK